MNAIEPPSMQYGRAEKSGKSVFYIVYLVMIVIPTVVGAFLFLSWIPRFKEIFRDFGTALPTLTVWFIAFADFMHSPLAWLPVAAVVGCVPWGLASLTVRFRTPTQRLTAAMMIMLIIMFLSFSAMMLTQVALMLPMVKLVRSISGGGT